MTMKLLDSVSVDQASVRRSNDGYLIANARVSRANNVQMYTGDEMNRPDLEMVRVFRPESEVFSQDAMSSAAHKPMTNDHPSESVSAETWKRDAIGQMGDEISRDGEFVRVPLIMMDASAIKDYESGKRELSLGYTADIDWTAGVTGSGEKYDAIQRNIRVNHVALVSKGRANQKIRAGDGGIDGGKDRIWGVAPLDHDHDPKGSNMTMSTVVLGDKAVQVAASDAPAIESFKAQMADAMKDAETKHTKAVEAKDAEIAKKQAEIDDLKGKVLDDAALDKRVQERADLVGKAKTIAKDLKTTGVSDADIRKAAVVAKLGDEAVKDKPQAYIDARFDILVEDSASNPNDPLRTITSVKPNDGASAWGDSTFKSAGVQMKKEA
ncbi:DUF2213 domain-containing protein [Marinobacter alexandrii]|uniref:DUF2213 domain-containing protein n=1 Tax=Marinobacter alexandrii TaxID=2570351 RepID=UPI001FFF06D4|nr:DUF2213 domain-containing protein [Marinobacter alexandrii]MCK2149524.1 DUF2213 domain-containing protein [Marinobacter alexandrii]